ncbi:MAG: ORF6N domain-containing protein, partial [Ferruginibacter sp.]
VIKSIQNRISEIRGERVILDSDLAILYETETKALNLAVKRNIRRFPPDFMFRLTRNEFEILRFQIETSRSIEPLGSQSVTVSVNNPLGPQITTSKSWGGTRYLPYAFTEHGFAMLSGIINSDKAINMNIAIMRAFIEIKKILLRQNDMKEQLKEIKERLGGHDAQLKQIYDAMENLLDEKAAQRKWEDRERIGFKKNEVL